jgi:hypothetical protein
LAVPLYFTSLEVINTTLLIRVRIQSRGCALADYFRTNLIEVFINKTYFVLRALPFGAEPSFRVTWSLLLEVRRITLNFLCVTKPYKDSVILVISIAERAKSTADWTNSNLAHKFANPPSEFYRGTPSRTGGNGESHNCLRNFNSVAVMSPSRATEITSNFLP